MPATNNQEHFRVRTDATAAQGGTPVWAAAQDVNVSIATLTNFRIRFVFSNTGSGQSGSTKNLFASRNGGAYAQVTTSTTFVQTVDATAGASSNGSTISTELLTGVGTFGTIGVYNDTGTTASNTVASMTCAEYEYGIVITASASPGDTFAFRMYPAGVVVNGAYNQTPTITVAAAAATYTGSTNSAVSAVAIANAWAPAGIVAFNGSPVLCIGIEVDAPPVMQRGNSPGGQSDVAAANAVAQAEKEAYEFFGGRAPFVPRYRTPPSGIIALPIRRSVERPWDSWWLPSDLPPASQVKLARGPPLQWIAGGNNNSTEVIFSGWVPGSVLALDALQQFAGVGVDAPPPSFKTRRTLSATLAAWVPGPVLALSSIQRFAGVGVDLPPPSSHTRVPISASLAAWVPGPVIALSNFQRFAGVGVDNPPQTAVRNKRQLAGISSWPELQSLQLISVPQLFVGVQVDKPPIVGAATVTPAIIDVLGSWQAPDLLPILPRNLPPAGVIPFVPSTQLTVAETVAAWTSFDAQAPTAGKLNPSFLAVGVSQPQPSSNADNQLASGGLWPALPDPLPVLPRYLPASVTNVVASQPPVSSSADNQLANGGAWPALPEPLPILPRNLPTAVTGVPVNNPPFGLPPLSTAAILTAWTPPDPPPTLPRVLRKLADGIISPAAPWLENVVVTWTPPDPAPIVRGNLNPSLSAVAVNNPPFGVPSLAQRTILEAWQPAPAQAPVSGSLNPAFTAVVVNPPPFGIPPRSASAIATAWVAPDAQAPVSGKLNPQLSAVRVDNPPIASSADNQLASGGLWPSLADPLPALPRYAIPQQAAAVAGFVPSSALWYLDNFSAWDQPYSLPTLASQGPPAGLPVTWWILTTTSTGPNWFGSLQDGGSAPASATTAYGYIQSTTALTTPFWRARQGATAATPANQALASSWVASTSGPTKGTGATSTTAGDSFITPVPYTGIFANSVWTFNWTFRATVVGSVGQVNMRVWASANADGTSARELTSGAISGSIVTIAVGSDVTSLISWSPGQLTLNNEYLFFQSEWQETTLGAANSNARVRTGADSGFISAPFTSTALPAAFVPSTPSLETVLGSWVAPDPQPIVGDQLAPVSLGVPVNNPPPTAQQAAQGAVLSSWLQSDPAPIVARPGPPQPILAAVPAKPPVAFETILTAWTSDPPAPILPRLLNPAFEAVIVNNPPVKGAALSPILASWGLPDQALPAARALPQGSVAPTAFVASTQLTIAEIFATWLPADPSAQMPRRAIPQTAVAAPFLASRQVTVTELAAAWAAPDPQVLPRALNPVIEAVAVNNPPGRRPDRLASNVAAWIQDDPAPVARKYIPQPFVASVVTPQSATAEVIVASWAAVDQLQTPPRFVPQSVGFVPSSSAATRAAILSSWTQDVPAFIAPRFGRPISAAGFVPKPLGSWPAILAAWQDVPAPPIRRRYLPSSAIAVRVDNAPVIGGYLTNLAVVLTAWTPSAYDPWFTASDTAGTAARGPLFVDPDYIVEYPAPVRMVEYPAPIRIVEYPDPIRTVDYP